MFILDWVHISVIGAAVTVVRVVVSMLKAWAREPLEEAKIEELTDLVETLNAGMDRIEAMHQAEREAWERSKDSFSAHTPNHEVSAVTPTSDEPKP